MITLDDQVTIENSKGVVSITELELPPNSIFIFGNETAGVEKDLQDLDHPVAHSPQIGTDKSINVVCAAAIVMYTIFLSKWKDLDRIDGW